MENGGYIQRKIFSYMWMLFSLCFIHYLKKSYKKDKLKFPGIIRELGNEKDFRQFTDSLYNKKWVFYCRPPFGGPEQVLKYIGRYIHRVAISNRRIIKVEDGNVTFSWRDYKDGDKVKEMTIRTEEFTRRFLLHILPDNFVKIRYYGILSSRNKNTKLKKCKDLLGCEEIMEDYKIRNRDLLANLVDTSEITCPCCGKGIMRTRQLLLPDKLFPPCNIAA